MSGGTGGICLHKWPWSYLVHIRPRVAVIKSQPNPVRRVRQEVCGADEARTAHAGRPGRVASLALAGRLASIPRPCVRRLHQCIIPASSRGPLDVMAKSSSGCSLHGSTSVRAYCRSRASCAGLHHAHSQLLSFSSARCSGRALLRGDDDDDDDVMVMMMVRMMDYGEDEW